MSKKLTIGILAHVDAGKTTLSETILYQTGSIRKMGRVDHKDAFLDTFDLEKDRGITIFSKQAIFKLKDIDVTLLDTPGHVDFSSEMERTLQVLDYAVLLINGADGIQGHTNTLWKLLGRYSIPTFIFVNKMDQVGTDREALLSELRSHLHPDCVDFSEDMDWSEIAENVAATDEELMEHFLETETISYDDVRRPLRERKVFPVYFGSALKNEGVDQLLKGLSLYTDHMAYPEAFGARVFNISRDAQGNRLTHIKMTGGALHVKEVIKKLQTDLADDNQFTEWSEKVDQIRLYSGKQFELTQMATPGMICALTGLTKTKVGDGLGYEQDHIEPALQPVLSYKIVLPEGTNLHEMLNNLRELEEEEPHLGIVWNKRLSEIHVQVMGEVEIEILKSIIDDRYGIQVAFDAGSLVYKESIQGKVIGVGHFEPLRHYAEVHLLLESGKPGSGMTYELKCSEDVLSRNWQRLILTHLGERHHQGVLTGAELTDMKITVIAGRAHNKHTEGGDFREATFRAVRQGLMQADSVLMEPMYSFRLDLPTEFLGRAMSDVQRLSGRHDDPMIHEETAVLTGVAPVATMMHYATEVSSYSRGLGRLSLAIDGYEPCHNAEEILSESVYDPELDSENPSSSVFCTKGSGYTVLWDQVTSYQHVDTSKYWGAVSPDSMSVLGAGAKKVEGITQDEVEHIFEKTYGPIRRRETQASKIVGSRKADESYDGERWKSVNKKKMKEERYLLVDGYNIIFSWEELKPLTDDHMDLARQKLIDMMNNYQSQTDETILVVFDAYRVIGGIGSSEKQGNVFVVFTKEAETADQYIERYVHHIRPDYEVTVATSDVVEQVIIMAKGARKLSAEGFREVVLSLNKTLDEKYMDKEESLRNRMVIDWADKDD